MSDLTGRNATRRALLALMAVLGATVLSIGSMLGVDLYLHRRAERSAGLNRWAYRGPVLGPKQPGERRIVALGGSTTFGYGVHWDEAWPARLEQELGSPTRVINLGYNNEGVYSYQFTLSDFAWLTYDVAILYTGANDSYNATNVLNPNIQVMRHDSPIYRVTGYFPIFPLVVREKAMLLRYGNFDDAYLGRKTVFRPSVSARLGASTLEAALTAERLAESGVGRIAAGRPETDRAGAYYTSLQAVGGECGAVWAFYCHQLVTAVETGLALGKQIVVVSEPMLSETRREQQVLMQHVLDRHFGPRVRYLDLTHAIDLADRTLAFDGMHPTPAGHRRIAQILADAHP